MRVLRHLEYARADQAAKSTGYYVIGALIIGIVAFFSFYDKQIVHFLQPTAIEVKK